MTQTYETKYQSSLTERLEAAATEMKVKTAPTVTKGRLYLNNGAQEERISFSGVSGTTLQNLTRGLSQTAEPATAGTGKTWLAGTTITLVAMHDQLIDKNEGDQAILEAKTYATTAARDSDLGGDGAATKAYYGIYVTATGLHYKYNLSTNQWESIDTGTAVPNASGTVSGIVRLSEQAQHDAGTTTESSNPLVPQSNVIQAGIQSGSALYGGASAAGSDTYVVSLTPAISSYTTGMRVRFKADVANTGACTININSVGATAIKTVEGTDPIDGQIAANQFVDLIYDGTNFVLQNPPARASDSEATTGTNDTKYMTPKQVKDNYSFTYSDALTRATDSDSFGSGDYTGTGVSVANTSLLHVSLQASNSGTGNCTAYFEVSDDDISYSTAYSFSVDETTETRSFSYILEGGRYYRLRGVEGNPTASNSVSLTVYKQEIK